MIVHLVPLNAFRHNLLIFYANNLIIKNEITLRYNHKHLFQKRAYTTLSPPKRKRTF